MNGQGYIDGKVVQYAVEVKGRGYYSTWSSNLIVSEAEADWSTELKGSNDSADDLRRRYERLGCPDVAALVRVVTRTVNIKCSKAAPLGVNDAVLAASS